MSDMKYGSDASLKAVGSRLGRTGIDVDDYIEFFGYPSEVKDMRVDPKWFYPLLPGMEDFADVVTTMTQAEDLLRVKKREAFVKQIREENRGDDFNVRLTPEEIEVYLRDAEKRRALVTLTDIELREAFEKRLGVLMKNACSWTGSKSVVDDNNTFGEQESSFSDPSEVMAWLDGYQKCLVFLIDNTNHEDPSFVIRVKQKFGTRFKYNEFIFLPNKEL